MKKIAIVCGTGVATSTVVMSKIADFLDERDIQAETSQMNVNEIMNNFDGFDLIVSTTHLPGHITTRSINAVPLLTGFGADEVFDEIEEALKE